MHNSEQAKRDRSKREDIVRETERRLANLVQLDGDAHHQNARELRAHSTFGRYVRQLKSGKLTMDKAKIATEAKLDGKCLLSTSDDHLSAGRHEYALPVPSRCRT